MFNAPEYGIELCPTDLAIELLVIPFQVDLDGIKKGAHLIQRGFVHKSAADEYISQIVLLGDPGDVLTHYSYGYATHLVTLDSAGKVNCVVAAHDGGRIINPTLFESQIEGAVVMGLGYALSEELPMENGQLKTRSYGKLGIPRIKNVPNIVVKMVEVRDPLGPYGAKGVGEIGNIPTAGAVANALFRYDGLPRHKLPMKTRP